MIVGRRHAGETPVRRQPLRTPPRVLVAEDDPDMRALVGAALRKEGYEVIELADGARLLFCIVKGVEYPEHAPDLVVTDLRMPVTSGLRVLEAARELGCDVPFILFTAFGDGDTRAKAEEHGAHFLNKPFPLEALRAAVADVFAA